jgi:phage gp29-like protein
MQTPKAPKLHQEIASTGDGRDITKGFISGLQQPYDPLVRSRGNDLRLYEQVYSDWQVKACFSQRQLAVVAKEWTVQPGGERRIDQKAAEHLEQQLKRVGWDRITACMLFGVFYGFAVAELVYGRDDQYITLEAIKVRNRRRFRYDAEGALRLLTPGNWQQGEACPSPYFWHFCTGADNDDEPYGLGLAHWLYWPAFFKRNGLKFWLIFLEKFGMPTAVGKYQQDATEPERKKLLEATRAIQTDSGIIMPDGMMLELIEAGRSGTADYQALQEAMDAAIAKVTIGQTASSQGTAGRLGNDDLQGDVRLDLIKADADLICESFNLGPARWLTAWNFPGAEPPVVFRQVEQAEDMQSRASRDETVLRMSGFKPTRGYIQETYEIELEEEVEPAPALADPQEQEQASAQAASFAESGPPADPAEAMTPQLGEDLQPAIEDWQQQLRALLDQASSPEDLRERLLELAPQLSLDQYSEAMATALEAAEMAGHSDVSDDLNARGSA